MPVQLLPLCVGVTCAVHGLLLDVSLHVGFYWMATSRRRARFTPEVVACFLSNESFDDVDFDELFKPSDLEEDEDKDDNDLVPRNAADGSDEESSAKGSVFCCFFTGKGVKNNITIISTG